MSFNASQIYHLARELEISDIEELPAWVQPTPVQLSSIGLVEIHGEKAVPLGNSGIWFRVRISTKKISKSELALQMSERIDDFKIQLGRPPTGQEKAEWSEQMHIDMYAKADPTHKEIDVLIRDGWLMIMNTSKPVNDAITDYMRETLRSLPVKPVQAEGELVQLTTALLKSDSLAVDNCELGDKFEGSRDDGTIIKTDKTFYDDDLRKTLQKMTTVTKARIRWGDIIATVDNEFTLSSIKSQVEETEHDDVDDPIARQRAEALYYAESLPRMVSDMAAHTGGLVRPEIQQDIEEAA